jgi:hypothetical protein
VGRCSELAPGDLLSSSPIDLFFAGADLNGNLVLNLQDIVRFTGPIGVICS